jgi:hypothetical protein
MIVKNEAHVIKDTLQNLYSYIKFSYYVISDTGSTDDTIEVIKTFFDSKNIKGEIHNDEWKDFGYNRSLALKHAFKKTKYLFIFDADDRIYGNLMVPILNQDSYYLKFGTGVTYKRVLLVNNQLEWEFVGVLHEYISCITKKNSFIDFIDGNYFIDSGKSGDRSKDPEKYKKDAIILENAFYEAVKTNNHLKIRYSFYCAQSYRDSGQKEKAIEWYKRRAELKDWNQEVYFSYFMVGKLYNELGEFEKAIYYWTLAYEADKERYESIYEIISHFRKKENYMIAYHYYLMIGNHNPDLNDKLFVFYQIYEHQLIYEMSIIFFHIKKYKEGIEIYKKIFSLNSLGVDLMLNILNNFVFYSEHIEEYDPVIHEKYFDFVKNIYLKTNMFIKNDVNHINKTIKNFTKILDSNTVNLEKIKKNIVNKNKSASASASMSKSTSASTSASASASMSTSKSASANTSASASASANTSTSASMSKSASTNKITVFLSITSCKRYDLFVKTMNSFLVCCKDITMIDYFFCVDDNSSKEDRKNMLKNYPFFQYCFKKEDQKGHLKSMNIIWDKLNELKPKYWLHMEDDWLFIKPCNYITKSINFLEKYKNNKIHQILFNKNYGEIIDCYNLVGGKKLDNDFILHVKDEADLKGRNCAYWAHYSFRPSVCLVETILKLGNYDSPNTFFEMDYANKYTNNGYQSAFFNEISCIHTGRLTSERGDSSKKNAYQLNGENQFSGNDSVFKLGIGFYIDKNYNVDVIKFICNYAICNRTVLNNISYIFTHNSMNLNIENINNLNGVDMLKYDSIEDINNHINKNKINYMYLFNSSANDDNINFKNCITLFQTYNNDLIYDKNKKYVDISTLGPIIEVDLKKEDYRGNNNISADALVLGIVSKIDKTYFEKIKEFSKFVDIYFIVNNEFELDLGTYDKLIYINNNDFDENKFINTCDGVIYNTLDSVLELKLFIYSAKNKPIISKYCDIPILKDNVILYDNINNIKEEINKILEKKLSYDFSSKNIMNNFKKILDNVKKYDIIFLNDNVSVCDDNFKMSNIIKKIFKNNDFNNNKITIYNLLTHYNLWKKLNDDHNYNYYIILDCEINDDVIKKIEDIIELNKQDEKDITFLGNIGYLINKNGALNILKYINENGFKKTNLIDIFINNMNISHCIKEDKLFKGLRKEIVNDLESIDFNTEKNNNYLFLKNLDHFGNDINYKAQMSYEDLEYYCEINENCIGFNTLGFFKDTINMDTLFQLNTGNENDGLFINIERYNKKYNKKLVIN